VPSWADEVRRHEGPEPITLADYRNRHALYKLDPDLQAAHAAYAWVVTWDDHDNSHIRFFESRKRGYVRCELTPERWRTDLRVLDGVRDRHAPIGTLASFVVENGRPGAERA
jgi:phosphodiesterase/alkaline phosphatase D-like protein